MPSISRVTVYPIKSLDGHELTSCNVLPTGALATDRRYALVDADGKYINGKRNAAIHQLRATYSDDLQFVILRCAGQQCEFEIDAQQQELADWCGNFLQMECRLIEDSNTGFPDDTDSPGATWVSTASLEAITEWFPDLDLAEARRRFRFNIEVGDVPAFWEDSLVSGSEMVGKFQSGSLTWQATGICQRCVVPSRHSQDGTITKEFARSFAQQREANLPPWSTKENFDHFYRLGVNTCLTNHESNSQIQISDQIHIISD